MEHPSIARRVAVAGLLVAGGALAGVAAAVVVGGRAAPLAAQPARAAGPAAVDPGPGSYQLQVLPGPRREWLVLDTHTGGIQHWAARDGGGFVVTSAASRIWVTRGTQSETLTPAP